MKHDFLTGAQSCCPPDAAFVVAKENRSEYRGINKKQQSVRLFHVDGGLIRERIKAGKSPKGRERLRYERELMEENINDS